MSKLPEVSSKIREIIDPQLVLNNEILKEVMVKFEKQIKKGLKKATHSTSEIKCFVTYVQDLPNGTEIGKVKLRKLSELNNLSNLFFFSFLHSTWAEQTFEFF